MTVTADDFKRVLQSFTAAVEGNAGGELASLFAEDGTYHDGFYGSFTGRSAIATMLSEHFWGAAEGFSWQMHDAVVNDSIGYASYLFSYVSTLPGAEGKRVRFTGMSRFRFDDTGLIKDYREEFNTGAALVQLEFEPGRIVGHLKKKVAEYPSSR